MVAQALDKIKCAMGYHDWVLREVSYWEDPYGIAHSYYQERLQCAKCNRTLMFAWSRDRPEKPKYREITK